VPPVSRPWYDSKKLLPAFYKHLATPVLQRGTEVERNDFLGKTDITPSMSLARIALYKPSINFRIAASLFVLPSSTIVFCGVALRALASLGRSEQTVTSAITPKEYTHKLSFYHIYFLLIEGVQTIQLEF